LFACAFGAAGGLHEKYSPRAQECTGHTFLLSIIGIACYLQRESTRMIRLRRQSARQILHDNVIVAVSDKENRIFRK
jgi:hypothetical protein